MLSFFFSNDTTIAFPYYICEISGATRTRRSLGRKGSANAALVCLEDSGRDLRQAENHVFWELSSSSSSSSPFRQGVRASMASLEKAAASREIDKKLDEVESLLRTCDKKKKNDKLVIELLEQVCESRASEWCTRIMIRTETCTTHVILRMCVCHLCFLA